MRRLLPIVPIFLLILLNACANPASAIPPDIGTAVGQTQTAAMWTPTITSTPDPNEAKIVEWLNEELSAADPLEKTLDANYLARNVSFPPASGSLSTVFLVEIRCECAVNTQCCIPERMFVVAMGAMKKRAEKIIEQVPGNVSEVKVVCYDHGIQIAVMSAWWTHVKGYLLDENNGYQLGSQVWRSNLP
jgi:hypothetical protein